MADLIVNSAPETVTLLPSLENRVTALEGKFASEVEALHGRVTDEISELDRAIAEAVDSHTSLLNHLRAAFFSHRRIVEIVGTALLVAIATAVWILR